MTAASAGPACPATSAVSWDDARQLAHAVAPLPPRWVPIAEAAGTNLAAPLEALQHLPSFDTAAMDGFAVAGAPPWRVAGLLLAGDRAERPLSRGEALEIATGAPMPPGAEGVLRYEDARVAGGEVRGERSRVGNVRHAGTDVAAGVEVARPGSPVTPALIGLAASLGHDEVWVQPRPRVGLLVSGAELLYEGLPLEGGVRDALGPMLPPLVDQLGGVVTDVRWGSDRSLREQWEALAGEVDVVVVTGSTSVGASDQLPLLAEELGVRFKGVRCRPGHPQLLAGGEREPWLVGLPGNPFAAFVGAYTTLAPLLRGLAARPLPNLRGVMPSDTSAALHPRRGGTHLTPARWTAEGLQLLASRSSAYLGPIATQDGLAVLDPEWRPGAPVRLLET